MSAPTPEPRPRFTSLSEIGTSRVRQLLQQSDTTIIRGLWTLAPKRRRARVRWVVGVALLAVVGVLAADPSTREYFVTQVRDSAFGRRGLQQAAPSVSPGLAAKGTPAAQSSVEAALAPSAERPLKGEAVSWPAVGIAIPPSSAAGPAAPAPVAASASASALPRSAPATAKPKGRPHASFARATHKPPSGG